MERQRSLARSSAIQKFKTNPEVLSEHVIVYFELIERDRQNRVAFSKLKQKWTKIKIIKAIPVGKGWTFLKRLRSRISSFWSRSAGVHLGRSILRGRNATRAYMPLRLVCAFSSRQFFSSWVNCFFRFCFFVTFSFLTPRWWRKPTWLTRTWRGRWRQKETRLL